MQWRQAEICSLIRLAIMMKWKYWLSEFNIWAKSFWHNQMKDCLNLFKMLMVFFVVFLSHQPAKTWQTDVQFFFGHGHWLVMRLWEAPKETRPDTYTRLPQLRAGGSRSSEQNSWKKLSMTYIIQTDLPTDGRTKRGAESCSTRLKKKRKSQSSLAHRSWMDDKKLVKGKLDIGFKMMLGTRV